MPNYGPPRRAAASSPILAPHHSSQSQAGQEPASRQMKLKVLYTFDENKTNCLARWPFPLDVRTASLDAETQIGVIELKTCLQAIATASPEIVTGLGQDYTVYAYDYSEYETPLVGQGMLSWILASASQTPGAPAQHSRTMVTGRVGHNNLGLFLGNSQETLEVKLRLVPVPTSKQSEYLESMKKYRDISQVMPAGFDSQAWATFVQQNPNFMQQMTQSRCDSPQLPQPGGFGLEQVQHLLNGPGELSIQPRMPISRTNSVTNVEIGGELPRLPSPASSIASTTTGPKRRGRKPNPKSKAAKARQTRKDAPAPESTDPGYCTEDDPSEDGPRKRAKVMQVDWSGKQELGKQSESLRVAASTAASVRIHQPTAIRPSISAHVALDSQPRAPTPVGNPAERQLLPRLPLAKSSLSQTSQSAPSDHVKATNPVPAQSSATEPSPIKSVAESSPADIASSPPEFFLDSTDHLSPRLPHFADHFDDTDFFNGTFDDLFGDDENRSLDEEDLNVAAAYSKRSPLNQTDIHEADNPFLPQTLSRTARQEPQAPPRDHKNSEQDMIAKADPAVPTPPPTQTFSNLPASEPGRPPGLARSQTWAGKDAPHPASDHGDGQLRNADIKRPSSQARPRRGSDMGGQSGHKRKAAIQSKLASSIAKGEMPPYCDHCGAIETPTWRKAWAKIHSGSPEHVRVSDEEGGIIAWQTLQTDNKGSVCLYRIIKKTLAQGDEGFKQMLLCNPCGMYLLTRRCMRPKEMWDKSQRDPDDGNRRASSEPQKRDSSRPVSANPTESNHSSQPDSPSRAQQQSDSNDRGPQMPTLRRSAPSLDQHHTNAAPTGELDEAAAAAALEKAIRSSPHKFQGSQEAPIEIKDLTPRPTRRILFPSPTQSEKANSCGKVTPREQGRSREDKSACAQDVGKENRPPDIENDMDRFFNDADCGPATGISATPKSKSKYPWINKTPTQSPSKSASRALFRTPALPHRTPTKSKTPMGDYTPFTAHLNQLLSDAAATSPNNGSFDFAPLPALRNTPNSSRLLAFDFSQLDSQDLISTDIPMPSSPPPWNFTSFEDEGGDAGLWGDSALLDPLTSPSSRQNINLAVTDDSVLKEDVAATAQTEAVA